MKAAFALAALLALLQPQQQTFYSAKAEPKPVPAHTAQPFNPDYLYYMNCTKGGGTWKGRAPSKFGRGAQASAANSKRKGGGSSYASNGNCSRRSPSGAHPSPHPSLRPEPRRS